MKAIIRVGYSDYVLDTDKAVAIIESLEGAEVYESKYHAKTAEDDSYYTYHVYNQHEEFIDRKLTLITDEQYNMYKLAGKPENK